MCYDTVRNLIIEVVGRLHAEYEVANTSEIILPNAELILNNLSNYGYPNNNRNYTYCEWNFGDGSPFLTRCDATVTHTYQVAGRYCPTLTISNRNHPECVSEYRINVCIEVKSESSLEVPNVFSPDGDGINEYFQVRGESLRNFEGLILNRWGGRVFDWSDWEHLERGWNGKLYNGSDAEPGVYFYVIKATGIDGKSYNLEGYLYLLRGN